MENRLAKACHVRHKPSTTNKGAFWPRLVWFHLSNRNHLFTTFVGMADDCAWSIAILIFPLPVRSSYHSSTQRQQFTSVHLVCHSRAQLQAFKQHGEYLICSEHMLIIQTDTGTETS